MRQNPQRRGSRDDCSAGSEPLFLEHSLWYAGGMLAPPTITMGMPKTMLLYKMPYHRG